MNIKQNLLKKRLLSVFLVISVLSFSFMNFAVYAADDASEDNEKVIFTWKNVTVEDLRKKSDIKIEDLQKYMKKFPKLVGIEETLIEVQDNNDINLILLLAIIRLESGNGTSALAKNKNNLGGIRAKYGYSTFKSKDACIIYMANLLSEKYLTKGGTYYKGYNLTAISKSYSTASERWVELVSALIIEIQKNF